MIENSESQDTIPGKESLIEKSLNVEVQGLPYVFRIRFLEKTKDVKLSLHLPNWEKELPHIESEMQRQAREVGWRPISSEILLASQGMVGWINGSASRHRNADVMLTNIESITGKLPKDSKYKDAKGIGRFLMNNFMALMDLKRWSVTASPSTSGRLTDKDIYAWNERLGFPPENTVEDYIRKPQQPNMSQPIIRLLNS